MRRVAVALFLMSRLTAHAQSAPTVVALTPTLSSDGMVLTLSFASSVPVASYLKNSYLTCKNTVAGDALRVNPDQTVDPTSLRFVFSVPLAGVTVGQELDCAIALRRATNWTTVTTPHYVTSLSVMRESQLNAAKAESKLVEMSAALAEEKKKTLKAQADLATLLTKVLPTTVLLKEITVKADTEFRARFTTNSSGKIQVDLLNPSDISLKQWKSEGLDTEHAVQFSGLSPSTPYRLRAQILDHLYNDVPDVTKQVWDVTHDAAMTFVTLPALDKPPLSVKADSTSSAIVVTVNTSPQTSVEVLCEYLTDPLHDKYEKVDTRGSVELDRFGRPAKTVGGQPPYSFLNLRPGGKYRPTTRVLDANLKVNQETTVVDVKPESAFDFDQKVPVTVEVTALAFSVSWKASSAPDSASFTASAGPFKVEQAIKPVGEMVTATLPIKIAQNITAAGEQPVLMLSMKQGTVTRSQSFLLKFSVPSQADVQKAKADGTLSDAQVKAIQNVSAGAKSKSSIKWADILSAGLPLLIKLL